LKKYFEISETIGSGNPDTARMVILYHTEVLGYIFYSPAGNQIIQADLWECSIHPDVFPELLNKIKVTLPESIRIESTGILIFPDAEIMLPGAVYDADYVTNWMELSFGKEPDVVYITEKINKDDVILINAINQRNRDRLLAEFNEASFQSLSSSFLNRTSGENHEIQVLFYGRYLYVALYHQHALQFLNAFTFHTPEDVLYVLLNLCHKYQIDKENLIVMPEGFIDTESSVIKLLDQYFLNIQWPDDAMERKYAMPEAIPLQTAQLLERIISCVS
jgi:hypothetical protein